MSKPIIIVEGGQWGSEAKGAIAAHLCIERKVDYAVRTGAINAGHTVMFGGRRYAMQQIPVGWVNPNTALIIGAGAYIHPPTLFREIDMINEAMPGTNVLQRLFIDKRCGIHDEAHEGASKDANRHHSIGATGKGCSEAIVGKIRDRNRGYSLFANTEAGRRYRDMHGKFVDTSQMLNAAYDSKCGILIEGTQGTHLDLHLGPYPFTTSRMTSAANWVAECGLSPALYYEVVLVCRTFPIRVAGNSGPMPHEIEWTELAATINKRLAAVGMPHLVSSNALAEFTAAIETAAVSAVQAGRYHVPTHGRQSFNLRLSTWTAAERDKFRVAASELHRDALAICTPGTVSQLRNLFEMTTVTKKLRRIAEMDIPMLKEAIDINRPKWIALTFLDYVTPLLANSTTATLGQTVPDTPITDEMTRARAYIRDLHNRLGVPISLVSVGPAHEHAFNPNHLDVAMSTR